MSKLGPLMLDLAGPRLDPAEAQQLLHPLVGGVILFTRNYEEPEQLAALVQSIRRVRPELLIAADTEGGRVQRFRKGFLRLPPAREYGRQYDRDPAAALQLAYAGGFVLAAELTAIDIDLAFTPVLDIDAGASGVIGDRALASDPHVVAALGCAHAQGLRAAGMAATGKHFPGHGHVVPDSHIELPRDERGRAALEASDWLPFRALVRDGLESVMVAHVLYPSFADEIASLSPFWIGEILRTEMGFQGAVFSDDLSMGALRASGDVSQRFAQALAAGCDMIPVCNQPQDVAALLDGPAMTVDPASAARLAGLACRRERAVAGLVALRQSEKYINNISVLNAFIDVRLEP